MQSKASGEREGGWGEGGQARREQAALFPLDPVLLTMNKQLGYHVALGVKCHKHTYSFERSPGSTPLPLITRPLGPGIH